MWSRSGRKLLKNPTAQMRLSMELMLLFVVLVAFDLFNNKVLVGEKLQSSQVTLLVLDDSYGTDFFDTTERKSSWKTKKKVEERVEETKETKEAGRTQTNVRATSRGAQQADGSVLLSAA